MEDKVIELKSGKNLLLPSEKNAYKLKSGAAMVFIVREEGGLFGRPMLLTHIDSGVTIPGMKYIDDNYVRWHFQIEAVEDCILQVIEGGATRPLKRRFADTAGLDIQGVRRLEHAIIEYWESKEIRDDVFVIRSEKSRIRKKKESEDMIREAVSSKGSERSLIEEQEPERNDVRRSSPVVSDIGRIGSLRWFSAMILSVLAVLAVIWAAGDSLYLMIAIIAFAGSLVLAEYLSQRDSQNTLRNCMEQGLTRIREDGETELSDLLIKWDIASAALMERRRVVAFFGCSLAALVYTCMLSVRAGATAAVATALCGAIISRSSHSVDKRRTKALGIIYDAEDGLRSSLRGIEKVRLSGAVEHVAGRYSAAVSKKMIVDGSMEKIRRRTYAVLPVLILCALFMIMRSLPGIDPGSGHVAGIIAGVLITMSGGLAGFYMKRSSWTAADRACDEMMEEKAGEDMADEPAAPHIQDAVLEDGGKEEDEVIYELENVSYSYPSGTGCMDVSFTVKRGERLAIAGPSGSGKSTLIKLLTGSITPDSGSLRYRGGPLGGSSMEEVGIVMQADRLISGSIIENIVAEDPHIDRKSVMKAIVDSTLDEDVADMPMGYETLIRDGGGNISSGEQQKILIARALAKDPKVLIMDEAESELDPESRKRIEENIRMRGLTCIMVSHDYPSVEECDRMIVMKEGKITETGKPDVTLLDFMCI